MSAVLHKAYVDVNEEGTEAAAATGVVMRTMAVRRRPVQPAVFRADHPFLFVIRDNRNGAILFLGRVADPDSPMKTVLFLCTGNYYRSRFAEIVFQLACGRSGAFPGRPRPEAWGSTPRTRAPSLAIPCCGSANSGHSDGDDSPVADGCPPGGLRGRRSHRRRQGDGTPPDDPAAFSELGRSRGILGGSRSRLCRPGRGHALPGTRSRGSAWNDSPTAARATDDVARFAYRIFSAYEMSCSRA